MKIGMGILAICATISLFSQEKQMTPQAAYQRLVEGNTRFTNDRSSHPDRTAERRLETAELQQPFAAILGCSDSRVSPEIIFDQGIGDLFIVRVAGNVVDRVVLDSLEYTTFYLGSSLILVLGHENCGAVQAVIDGKTKDIEAVADLIKPAADQTKGQTTDRLKNTVKANVKNIIQELKKSKVLKGLIQQKKLDIRGGYYDFHQGKVEFID